MALTIASAKTFTIHIFEPAVLGATELKAGEYRLELTGNKIVVRSGKLAAEATVTVQKMPNLNKANSMRIEIAAGKQLIREIRLGGTDLRLVVN
jgi:hypothetical protein